MPKRTTSASRALTKNLPHLLLDTHIAIWLADGNSRLKPSSVYLLNEAFNQSKLNLSPISAWEIGLLASRGRLDLGQSPITWFDQFVRNFNVTILDITPEIAIRSSYLPGSFHGDPADRILVATALACSATIVSADKRIVSYGKNGFVKVMDC